MKMKKLIYGILLGTALLTGSCSDFTDVQPKGKNLLSTTDQLEMLLNNEFQMSVSDLYILSGDMIRSFSNVPTLINQPNKTRAAIIITWDGSNQDKMAELTSSDGDYTNCYNIIGKIANPILSHIDAAQGDETTKVKLKCEALVLRAYFHWLLVNKFAKAYNPSTAEQDPGIPYVTDEWDVSLPTEPVSVKKVYENILADLEKAIELNGLPTTAVNRMRMSKPCAYAAKALALISMQEFDLAAEAAREALALNKTVSNYNEMTTTFTSKSGKKYPIIYRSILKCEEDLFYTHYYEDYNGISPEAWNAFEEGHACRDKMSTDLLSNDNEPGIGQGASMMGLPDYVLTTDGSSGWNNCGMKTTHMYLIIAEAEIRNNNYKEAMKALDAIRVNRIDPSVYAPLEGTVTTKEDAIYHLKQTSHGENIYSYYNFINRKRWNQVEGYKETLTRNIAGQIFTLAPDSPMWIFPFPQNALNTNPNLSQNYKK